MREHSDSKNEFSEDDIIKMLEFLVDNIFVVFAEKVFQQTVCIPKWENCVPLLADIYLYSHEAEFIQSLLSTGKKQHLGSISLTGTSISMLYIVHKQPRIWKLSGPDVSCWTSRTQQRASLLLLTYRFTIVDLEGWSTFHFYSRQTRWFQFPNHKLSVP